MQKDKSGLDFFFLDSLFMTSYEALNDAISSENSATTHHMQK